MASKIQDSYSTQEERALKLVQKEEAEGTVGHTDDMSELFLKLRKKCRHPPPPVIDPAAAKLVDGEDKPEKVEKWWVTNNKIWAADFAQIDKQLKDLKVVYDDKALLQFEKSKKRKLDRKVAKIMKTVHEMFHKKKGDIEKFHKVLYAKDPDPDAPHGANPHCGPGLLFECITEWRMAERICEDLTVRLKERQQELSTTVLVDKEQTKNISSSLFKSDGGSDKALEMLEQAALQEEHAKLHAETDEVQSIVKNVQAIVKMVSDMAVMINEQGGIVDRIDYNLEVASVRTLKGENFFKKAENLNKVAGKMMVYVIGVLVFLNTGFAVALMNKWNSG